MIEKKYYPNELKQEILNKVRSGTRVVEIASSYGIDSKRIYSWISRNVETNPGAMEVNKLTRENKALKELIGELMIESKKFKKNMYGK
jgi:transposase-like protein